jgi:hypothetical protein
LYTAARSRSTSIAWSILPVSCSDVSEKNSSNRTRKRSSVVRTRSTISPTAARASSQASPSAAFGSRSASSVT